MRLFQSIIILLMVTLLGACATDSTIEPIPSSGTYRVVSGDSLYSIAWRYGLDYRKIAVRNGMKRPYYVYRGQVVYLRGFKPQAEQQASNKVTMTTATRVEQEPTAAVKHWRWPTRGNVIRGYSVYNKGINIAGHLGQPINASAAGKVVYCGHGLRGYGNLVIIKHNATFLTAYADASAIDVSEGESVKAGQKIAEMGQFGTRHPQLHFEIRLAGEPVNPLNYLSKNR